MKAKGDLLEVGCGTGRNFDYYTSSVKQITAVDAAANMVEQAQRKASRLGSKQRDLITVKQMNAQQLAFPDNSFDTVVDSFGVCSYDNPVSALREMQRVCRPGGRVLLIEHGRGSYDWINSVLDDGAVAHAANWGCIWNRDIESVVRSAGLEVRSVSRFHFGTTYLIEAAPSSK